MEDGKPVFVGVNHTLNRGNSDGTARNEGTTDHYIVVVGGYDEDKKEKEIVIRISYI